MAIRTVTLSLDVAAGQTGNALTSPIRMPIKPLALIADVNVAGTGDSLRVFLTRSDTAVSDVQPGDPDAGRFAQNGFAATGRFTLSIPFFSRRLFEAPLRLALSYTNTGAAGARVVVTFIFTDEEE